MFKDKTIQKRVMTVIKQKIQEAQELFDKEIEQLETDHETAIENLKSKLEVNKEDIADKHVSRILGKIL